MTDVTVSVVVTLTPSLAVGQTAQAVARIVTDVNDAALDTRPVVWSSTAPSVATVDVNGLVRAVAAGSAQIRATVNNIIASAPVTVTVPFVDITSAQEAAIKAFSIGSQFVLRGPTTGFTVQVNA